MPVKVIVQSVSLVIYMLPFLQILSAVSLNSTRLSRLATDITYMLCFYQRSNVLHQIVGFPFTHLMVAFSYHQCYRLDLFRCHFFIVEPFNIEPDSWGKPAIPIINYPSSKSRSDELVVAVVFCPA